MRKNILITGLPKSGKSTLLKKIISNFENKVGFITNEILENSERVGFEIETYSGEKFILAHINIKSDFQVSKYFVDVNVLDQIAPNFYDFKNTDLLYLDEIGVMELCSEKFKQLALDYLDSKNLCITTFKMYDDDFIKEISTRDDVIIITLTPDNREIMEKYVELLIQKIQKAKRYVSEPDRFNIITNQVLLRTDHGIRNLKKINNEWVCNCEFFKEHHICSHTIALEEYFKVCWI